MRSDIADDQQSLHISQRGPVRLIRMRIDLCFFNCILLSFPSRSCEAQGLLVRHQKTDDAERALERVLPTLTPYSLDAPRDL